MPEQIRVATYNLYLGADLGLLLGDLPAGELQERAAEVIRQLEVTAFPRRAPAIARLLVRERLDLVGLQEVCTWHQGDELLWDFTDELLSCLDALGEPYDMVADHRSFAGSGRVQRGGRAVTMRREGRNVILRRRASAVMVEETSSGTYRSALTMQLMDAAEVSIARGWCAARCSVGGTGFTFVDTHTEAYEEESRDQQRTELLAALPADQRLVLVGDFNATPDEVGMPGDMRDAWRAGGSSDPLQGTTCCRPGDLTGDEAQLSERIDYVWVRGVSVTESHRFGAEPEDRTVDGLWPSDHAGVAATLVLD